LYKEVVSEGRISLGKVASELLGSEIDKSWRMSNWENRPLKEA